MWQKSYDDSPTLYLVPTPIGNLDDITKRSIDVLSFVSVIFSEDTRVTSLLLKHLNIKKRLIALHDHNEDIVKDKVLDYLVNGNSVALVTDRGTPIISDPGYKTVKYIISKGYNVVALPGACAFVPALITSGIAPLPFLFYGFLNSKDSKCRIELEKIKDYKETIIFYEAPHRIERTLRLMLEILGDRNISVSREISKKFESVYRGKISKLISSSNNLKGEFVIVLEGNNEDIDYSNLDVISHIELYIDSGIDVMNAIKKVAKDRNISKNEVYKIYHTRRKK